jgi:hypothetical protein
MTYTSFKSIPAEAVATDDATWTVIRNTIKCPENMKICEACMNVIKEKYVNDPVPYKAQAYRRAAILVANADFPLLTQKGLESLYPTQSNPIGLPKWGNTSSFIREYIRSCILTDKLKKNIYEAFPPTWRGGLLEDDARINIALEVLDMFLNKTYMWTIYQNSIFPEKQEAFQYYLYFTNNQREIIMNHIKNFVTEACC